MPNTYTPDPFKNFTPRGNPPSVAQEPIAVQNQIDDGTLVTLDMMTQPELVALIRRVSGAMWGVGLLTDDQRAEAMLDRLAIIALTNVAGKPVLEAMREWLDRKQGRAIQRIEQKNLNVNLTAAKEMTTEQIMARLSNASQASLEGAGVRLIGGKVERVVD